MGTNIELDTVFCGTGFSMQFLLVLDHHEPVLVNSEWPRHLFEIGVPVVPWEKMVPSWGYRSLWSRDVAPDEAIVRRPGSSNGAPIVPWW